MKEGMNMKLTGAQIMMKVLKEEGVDTIFGYPGGVPSSTFMMNLTRTDIKSYSGSPGGVCGSCC